MNILLSGAGGRIGREVQRLVDADPALGIAGHAARDSFFSDAQTGDVIIDFSRPEAMLRALRFARMNGIPLVTGTTGLNAAAQSEIETAAADIAICRAANFSIGINLLLSLVARAASSLPSSFDIEVSEIHHRWKVDAPSGTALALGEAAASASGRQHRADAAIRGAGERCPDGIGYQVMRGGDVAGEHRVFFLGDGEALELGHRVTDRSVFARGALHAARWLRNQPAGLYSMQDILADDRRAHGIRT